MRVALVTETFFPAVDGTTTTVKAVADRLVELGHHVLVVAPAPGLSTYRGNPVARIRPLDRRGPQVLDAFTAFGPVLVHVTSPGAVGRRALTHTRRLGVPALVVEQSPLLDVAVDTWRARVAGRADRVLVTSRWMLDRVTAAGTDAGLWAPGVDTVAFTPTLRDHWLPDRWARATRPLRRSSYWRGGGCRG